MPKVRTATIAVSSMRMTGRSLARTISQPEVAVRAMPDAVATPPSSPAPRTARMPRTPGPAGAGATPGATPGATAGATAGACRDSQPAAVTGRGSAVVVTGARRPA